MLRQKNTINYNHIVKGANYFYAWEDLSSTVIRLPNLEELKLKRCQFWNNRWSLRANDKVQSLKLLLLSDLYLDVWEASSDNFPKLKRLVLKNCENLQEVSLDFGEIGTLGSIELHDCSTTVEDSARKIEQEQEDMGNNSLKVTSLPQWIPFWPTLMLFPKKIPKENAGLDKLGLDMSTILERLDRVKSQRNSRDSTSEVLPQVINPPIPPPNDIDISHATKCPPTRDLHRPIPPLFDQVQQKDLEAKSLPSKLHNRSSTLPNQSSQLKLHFTKADMSM
ncbi:putative defensin-like protein-like [Capsicum annuum]|nr:putative defensin-like protein-like [Capsicum annuum]